MIFSFVFFLKFLACFPHVCHGQVPSIRAEATVQWQLGDHWAEGPTRDAAMRQTHTVQLVQPMLGEVWQFEPQQNWRFNMIYHGLTITLF